LVPAFAEPAVTAIKATGTANSSAINATASSFQLP
jgi:hypothetical protein